MNKNITKIVGVRCHSKDSASVVVWSPFSTNMQLKIKGQKNIHQLAKDPYGYWETEESGMKPGTLYKFILDRDTERPDPASASQPGGVHSWSEVIDQSAFKWTDGAWKSPPMEEMILYELHVGTFTPEGTFEAIIDKLDYLKDLGITGIELMPIAQFPGNRNWGYDGVYPFAPQNSYGGVEKLKHMVDKCHHKGIAVILDVVYNHMGPEGNYLADFGPYFTDKYHTPWGSALNFDDAYSDHIRNFFLQNAIMWLEDYHFDGLRLDAVHAILDNGPVHFLKELRMQVDKLEERTGKNYFLIAESDMNDVKILKRYEKGGYGLDAQWSDDFHHAVHTLATGEKEGYYGDYGELGHLAKSFGQAFVYDGIYSEFRKKKVGNSPREMPPHQFVVCIQNHDQVGNRMLGERFSSLVSFDMLKLSAGVMLASPFLPMLFMGEEYGEGNPFQYFVSHGDPELVKAVQEGRKGEFESFQWDGEVPDPQSEGTFSNSKLLWDYQDNIQKTILFKYYQQLIKFRKKGAFLAFKALDKEINADEKKKILTIFAGNRTNGTFAIFNFSHTDHKVSLPKNGQRWSKLIASADIQWGGPWDQKVILLSGDDAIVPATSLSIYRQT